MCYQNLHHAITNSRSARGDTATPGCVIKAQAGVPVSPGTGRAQFSAFWKDSAAYTCYQNLHHAITNSRRACGDTATPGCVIEAQAGVPVPPGTARAESLRLLEIICGFHVL